MSKELVSVMAAEPLLSTCWSVSMEKKPPLRLEVPSRMVVPMPLSVPFVQVNAPSMVKVPVLLIVELRVRPWFVVRLPEVCSVPPETVRLLTVSVPEKVTVPELMATSSPEPGTALLLQFAGSDQLVPSPPPDQVTAEGVIRSSSGSSMNLVRSDRRFASGLGRRPLFNLWIQLWKS